MMECSGAIAMDILAVVSEVFHWDGEDCPDPDKRDQTSKEVGEAEKATSEDINEDRLAPCRKLGCYWHDHPDGEQTGEKCTMPGRNTEESLDMAPSEGGSHKCLVDPGNEWLWRASWAW
jgi:hypothetical protein